MKSCTFESETDSSNGIQKISLKGKNGGGVLNVMCIDLSKSNLSYDMEYILENFGDYYFRQTASQMNGITENDFMSNYRMTSKLLYQRGNISVMRQFRKPTVWYRSLDTRRPMLC